MKDATQAIDFIETALNGLEKSVNEKNETAIQQNTQSFNTLISEYRSVLGRNETQKYLNNYREIIKK